ncbi:PhzF family isomerase [Micromonospora zhanjiangensis]
MAPTVTVVRACLRDGAGGSPTAVLPETGLSDRERRAVPALLGTSHAVFVSLAPAGPVSADVSLRFFTTTGELPACGHGTVAALAYLAAPRETTGGHGDALGPADHSPVTLRTPGRVFTGRVGRVGREFRAAFDPGPVTVREPAPDETVPVLRALGLDADPLAVDAHVATLGRPRLLVPVSARSVLAGLAPDLDRLRVACDRLGLLGCYVYHGPTADGRVPGDSRRGRVAARMFAPSIGVPEDIANANSTACLAAHLARAGTTDLTVDMGDALGVPASISTTVRDGDSGPLVEVGGAAVVDRVVHP